MSTNRTNDQPAGEVVPLHAVNAVTAGKLHRAVLAESNGRPSE
jgi:hypothetical protein